MNIHWVKAYYVDNENSSVEVVQRDGQLNEYVEYYIDALRNTHRTSPYLPSSQSTQVLSLVACLANETLSNCDSITLEKYRSEINQRFLEKETEAQEKIARMSKVIKNGCLIHAFVSIDEHNYYLLAKLDWQEFLEKVSMKHSSGIVFDKKILGRSCLIELKVDELNTGIAISSIEISSDTTEVKYFVDEFLEVIPLFNDELSTKRMTASVVGLIDKTFRKSNPRERLELKNAFLFEIRNSGRIDYPQIVDRVFRRFFSRSECPIPVAEANKFLDKVNKLPKDKGFANQFNPVPSAINKRIIKSSYNLGHGMELSIKEVDGVNLMNEVMAGYENDGRGYLKIYTDEEEALRTFRMN